MIRDGVSGKVIDQRSVKTIRGGRGFGDALYIRPFAEHFQRENYRVRVLTDYRDVFRGLDATVEPFNRNGANVIAHYVGGKHNQGTTQWQDVCNSVGVQIPQRIEWKQNGGALLDTVRAEAKGRPIVLVNGGRYPMNRPDGFGLDLLPQKRAFDVVVGALSDCLTIRIGKGPEKYGIDCELDLSDATGAADVIDLAAICSGIVGQCSFAIPLAEVFDKPLLMIWSVRAKDAEHEFVRMIEPRKVLSKPTDSWVLDAVSDETLRNAARAFRSVF